MYRLVGKPIPVNPNDINSNAFLKEVQKQNPSGKSSSRPFLVFLGLIIGLPWLMSKLIRQLNSHKQEINQAQSEFHPSQLDFAKALYDFNAQSPAEISLQKGQIIAILEKVDQGWWKGRTQSGQIGFFPANRVEIIEKKKEITPAPPPLLSAQEFHHSSTDTLI